MKSLWANHNYPPHHNLITEDRVGRKEVKMMRWAGRERFLHCVWRKACAKRPSSLFCCRFFSSSTSQPRMIIVFGSQTGNAEAFANDLEFDAEDFNIDTELIDANDCKVDDLISKCSAPNTLAALIMASYGEGEPTDNAKALFEEINSATSKSKFSACNYAIFGLGNSQCFPDRYNIVARKLDERLKFLGATPVIEMGLGDAAGDMSTEFTNWKEKLFLKASTLSTAASANSKSLSEVCQAPQNSFNEKNDSNFSEESNAEFEVRQKGVVLSPRQLALVPSDRAVYHATVESIKEEFNVTDEFSSAVTTTFNLTKCRPYAPLQPNEKELTSGIQAGDHIGIFAPNSPVIVKKFIAIANISDFQLQSSIEELQFDTGGNSAITLLDFLTWHVQLSGTVPITTLKILLRWTKDDSVSAVKSVEYLSNLISNYHDEVRRRGLGISSVLGGICVPKSSNRALPFPLQAVLKSLPAISPRLYSLTNDPETENQSKAALLCRLLRYRDCVSGSLVSGLSSSYLCERLKHEDEALLFFRQSNFHLPSDPSTPIIMICGGSGIAPFLSFLEKRENVGKRSGAALGPAVLYYGCRNTNEYMFRSMLQGHLESQSLSRLVVAFSNESTEVIKAFAEDGGCHGNEEVCVEGCNITDRVSDDITAHLKDMMQDDAHVYVCGGAGHFGPAVRATVEELSKASHGDKIDQNGPQNNGVRYLVKELRYFEDLAD